MYGIGYAWNTPYLTINSGDSVVWSWSPPTKLIDGLIYQIIEVADPVSTTPIGFESTPSSTGN